MRHVKDNFKRPILYVDTSFAEEHLNQEFSHYKLWLADYAPSASVPKIWPHYTLWQYTSSGRVGGISGAVDMDKGNLKELQATEFVANKIAPKVNKPVVHKKIINKKRINKKK